MFLKFKKTICLFIILGLLITFFYAYKTPAVYAMDGGAGWANFFQTQLKEWVLDPLARFLSRRIMSRLLDSVVQGINTGGRTPTNPTTYVQNWRNFLTDAMYRGEDVFRVQLGNTETCLDFRNGLKARFGAPPAGQTIPQNTRVNNLDPFSRRARCTMPAGWNQAQYKQDFAGNGGWDALVRLSEPQNNFYGATLMSLGELSAQRALDVASDERETSRGYTGVRAGGCQSLGSGGICTGNKCIGGPRNGQTCEGTSECAVLNAQARCTFLGKVTTPGDVLGEAASNYVDKNLGWLVTSDELLEVLFALLEGVITKKLNDFGNSEPAPPPANEAGADTTTQQCLRGCDGQDGDAYQACVNQCYDNGGGNIPGNPDSLDPGAPSWYVPPSDGGSDGGGDDNRSESDGGGCTQAPCASAEEIAAFLEANPGDEGRLNEAFPVP